MARLIVLIFRLMPLEIIIGIIAVITYFALASVKNASVAKEVLIKIVLFVNTALFVALALITLYSVLDNNWAMIELSGCCAIICAVAAMAAIVCKRVFLKNRPNYPWKRVDFKKFFKKDNSVIK